jgi:hypothetical protein
MPSAAGVTGAASRLTPLTGRRTLPVGIKPVPGEALESWLAALARQLDMPWGQFVKYSWMSCSQVIAIPPCIWTDSAATFENASLVATRAHAADVAEGSAIASLTTARAGLHCDVEVGHPLFERLEAADRAAELHAVLGVFDGQSQTLRRRADLCRRHCPRIRRHRLTGGRSASIGRHLPRESSDRRYRYARRLNDGRGRRYRRFPNRASRRRSRRLPRWCRMWSG